MKKINYLKQAKERIKLFSLKFYGKSPKVGLGMV